MGYCFHCGRKMKRVVTYGICKQCERGLENLWDYAMSLVGPEDPEGTVWYNIRDGGVSLVQETPDKTVL